jgi:acyl carrier protein
MSIESSGAMTSIDIARRIHDFVLTNLLQGEDAANLADTTPLVSSGVINSLSTLEMGAFLEETFDVQIAPEELANPETMETIASMVALVEAKRSAGV